MSHQVEIAFWQSIENSNDIRDFEDYLNEFSNGHFTTLAHRRISHAKISSKGKTLLDKHKRNAPVYAAQENNEDLVEWVTM